MSAAQEAMLKAVRDHTEATTDLIWALCWLSVLSSEGCTDDLRIAFREKLEERRQDRPIFHALCSEVRV
jgi:hypothetical protein